MKGYSCITLLLAFSACGRAGNIAPVEDDPVAPLALSAGEGHTAFLLGGVLFTLGSNERGALGTPLADGVRAQVSFEQPFVDVTVASSSACALDDSGTVHCWGANDDGQVGVGTVEDVSTPSPILFALRGKRLGDSSFNHHCLIAADDSLWCWGLNTEDQVGRVDPRGGISNVPSAVMPEFRWRDVSAGGGHTLAIREDGTLWCWGRNTTDECGLGEDAPGRIFPPEQVGVEQDWQRVSATQSGSCGLRSGGALFCWGENSSGQVEQDPSESAPTPVLIVGTWRDFDIGTFHTCGVDINDELWCWGRAIEGQLGLPSSDVNRPSRFSTGLDDVLSVDVGRFHSCAQQRSGRVLCTGDNRRQQLGLEEPGVVNEFFEIELPR